MANYFQGVELQKTNGSKHSTDVLKDKIVGIYFSAHWCPPCRMFTPILKDFYNELKDSEEFEVVFVSFDRSSQDLQNYLSESHGDWYHVPFGSDKIKELSQKFEVSGIPALVIVKPDGTIVTKEGRGSVQGKNPQNVLRQWKA
ncbi:unnamed protein product [Auanema sp. JU1783]|nr:unnamed protein product [Auanema sp. JU1783]